MNKRRVLIVRLVGLLLAGSLTLPVGAAPGLPLTDPFGVRFTPVPVRVAPLQGRPLRFLHGWGLGWPRFSPDGRFLAYSRTVTLVKPPGDPEYVTLRDPVDEIRLLDVRTGRVSTLLSPTQAGTSKGNIVNGVEWIDRYLLRVSVFDADDASFFVTTVHVPSRKVVAGAPAFEPELSLPTRAQQRARDRARTLFPDLDEGLLSDDAWAFAVLDGDRSVIIGKRTMPGGIWLLDFRRRAVRHLVAFKEPDALLGGAITVGESTLFLLAQLLPRKDLMPQLNGRARLFLYRGDRTEPLINVRIVNTGMSPLLVTRNRVYFLLPWVSGPYEAPRAALYSFDLDSRTFQQSNDYPSLFAADIDPSGRLVALAYRMKTENRIVVAELAR